MQDDPREFEKLSRLLALKRREVPPPGYFDSFSDKVIDRIEASERERAGIWQQISTLFRTRPAISWSFSVAAVLTVFVAGSGIDSPSTANQANSIPAFNPQAGGSAPTLAFSTNRTPSRFGPTLTLEPVTLAGTNGEPKLESLFSTPFYQQVQAQPVSFNQ